MDRPRYVVKPSHDEVMDILSADYLGDELAGRDVVTIQEYLAHGDDIHIHHGGFGIGHFSAIIGNSPMIQTCIERGIDVNAQTSNGETMASLVVRYGNSRFDEHGVWSDTKLGVYSLRKILEAGVDLSRDGQHLMTIARSHNFPCVPLLACHGVDPSLDLDSLRNTTEQLIPNPAIAWEKDHDVHFFNPWYQCHTEHLTYVKFHRFMTGKFSKNESLLPDNTLEKSRWRKILSGLVMDRQKFYRNGNGFHTMKQVHMAYEAMDMMGTLKGKIHDDFIAMCASHSALTGDETPLSIVMGIV